MIPRPLTLVIVTVVTLVWAVTITAPLWRPDAQTPNPAIHAVFMVIVGGALRLSRPTTDLHVMNRVIDAISPDRRADRPPAAESETP